MWYTQLLVYTLRLVNCDNLLQHLRHSFVFACAESKKTCQAWETPPLLIFDILTRQTAFQCSVSARGSGGIDVFEKILTGSSLLSSRRFSLVHYFTARDLFSFVCTDTLNNYSFIKPGALSPDYGS